MADCNNCSSYLSSEDIIRRSVKCSGGSLAFIGSNVNPQVTLPKRLTIQPEQVICDFESIVGLASIGILDLNTVQKN